jgi:hypothetical protein
MLKYLSLNLTDIDIIVNAKTYIALKLIFFNNYIVLLIGLTFWLTIM